MMILDLVVLVLVSGYAVKGISQQRCLVSSLGFEEVSRVPGNFVEDIREYEYYLDIHDCFNHCKHAPFVGVSHQRIEDEYHLSCLCGVKEPISYRPSVYCATNTQNHQWTAPTLYDGDICTALYENVNRLCFDEKLAFEPSMILPFKLISDFEITGWYWSEFSYDDCRRQCLENCFSVIGISYQSDEDGKFLICQCSVQLPVDRRLQMESCPIYELWKIIDGPLARRFHWSVLDTFNGHITRTVVFMDNKLSAKCTISTTQPLNTSETGGMSKSATEQMPNTNVKQQTSGMASPDDDLQNNTPYIHNAATIGGAVGGVVTLIAIVIVTAALILCIRRRKAKDHTEQSDQHVYYNTNNSPAVDVVPPVIYSTRENQPIKQDDPEEPRYVSQENDYAEPDITTADIYAQPRRNRNVTSNDNEDIKENDIAAAAMATTDIYAEPRRNRTVDANDDDVTVVDNIIYDEGYNLGVDSAKEGRDC